MMKPKSTPRELQSFAARLASACCGSREPRGGRFALAAVEICRASRADKRGRQLAALLPCWVCRAGVCYRTRN